MSVGCNVWNEPAGQAAQPGPARLADHALVHPSMDAHDKARFAATRACVQRQANPAQHKTLRVEHALRLIPPFQICRSLVRADLRAAYGENRLNLKSNRLCYLSFHSASQNGGTTWAW